MSLESNQVGVNNETPRSVSDKLVRKGETQTLVPIRCPKCHKLLAKCSVLGLVEIGCTRCGSMVQCVFA